MAPAIGAEAPRGPAAAHRQDLPNEVMVVRVRVRGRGGRRRGAGKRSGLLGKAAGSIDELLGDELRVKPVRPLDGEHHLLLTHMGGGMRRGTDLRLQAAPIGAPARWHAPPPVQHTRMAT